MTTRSRRGRVASLLSLLLLAAALVGPAPASASTPASVPAGLSEGAPIQLPWSASRLAGGGLTTASPPGAVLAAADGLDVSTAATYVVDPAARKVRVSVDVTAVNQLADTAAARYYFPGLNLAIQPEATGIAADEGGRRDQTTTQTRDGYRLLKVQFASRLFAGQSVHVHIAYALPAGAPRSASGVRVGKAYTTFVAWAFGDRGSVEVDVPAAFTVDTAGSEMSSSVGPGGVHVLAASTSDPAAWYAWIDARNDSALTSQTLKLPQGEQVVVRAWPEDTVWQRRVAQALSSGIPALVKRIGLPWPVAGPLSVYEVSSSQLEGYAGFYSPDQHQITISEDLDPLVIVHEASHAWFNAALFTDRWITEGLADEYAYLTLRGLGVAVNGPPTVRTTSTAAFPLDTWGPPAAIRSKAQDAREQWGYDASWTVMREVVNEVGQPGMAKVFAAADAHTTAYVGNGPPETATIPNDWRRLVDLAEEVGGGTGVAEMIAPWVLTPGERSLLSQRAAARTAYHALEANDGAWAAPVVVRMDLDGWDFTAATTAIAQSAALIRSRDAIRAEAATEGLTVPSGLEAAYERAATMDALTAAASGEDGLLRALDAVARAGAAAAAPRGWLVDLGLIGQDPATALAAARTSWQAGDAAGATAAADAVAGQLKVAADAGRLRVVAVVLALLAVLLLAVAIATVRRRRARHLAARAASGAADLWGSAAVGLAAGPDDDVARPAGGPDDGAGVQTSRTRPGDEQGPEHPGIGPPPPPAGWHHPPPTPPAGGGRYPILPASTTSGEPPESPADVADEEAE